MIDLAVLLIKVTIFSVLTNSDPPEIRVKVPGRITIIQEKKKNVKTR